MHAENAILKAIKTLGNDLRTEMYAGFGELRRDMDSGFKELRRDMEDGFAHVADQFVHVDERLDGIDGRLDKMAARFDKTDAKLDTFATRAEFQKMHLRLTTVADGHGVLLKRMSRVERRVFGAA
ncbi:MAG: hypothetical protein RLZZ324_195 [Candidatus Parcubacteria bacterium]|jgi:hypothetical protein